MTLKDQLTEDAVENLPRIQWEILTKFGQKFYVLSRDKSNAIKSVAQYGVRRDEVVSASPIQ